MQALSEFLRKVVQGEENVLEVSEEVLGPDEGDPGSGPKRSVTVALQNRLLQPEPIRAPERKESPARAHVFNEVDGFCAYINRYGGKNTVVLGYVTGEVIRAVLDDTSALGREIVNLSPDIHPLLEPWEKGLGRDIPVREFAEFIILNRRQITDPEPKSLAMILSQIRLSKEIEVQSGRGLTAVNGVMIKSRIQGIDQSDWLELPETICIVVPIFVGTPPVRMEIDLMICEVDGEVIVRMASSDLKTKELEAFEAMVQDVKSKWIPTAGAAVMGLGSVSYTEWQYLDQVNRR
jgi:hypothetical protein